MRHSPQQPVEILYLITPGPKEGIRRSDRRRRAREQLILLVHQRPHFVAKECVKAGVTKADLRAALAQLFLPVPTQHKGRVGAADGMFPEMGKPRGPR